MKEKGEDGICDIMIKAKDANKVARIANRLEIGTLDTKAINSMIDFKNDFKFVLPLTFFCSAITEYRKTDNDFKVFPPAFADTKSYNKLRRCSDPIQIENIKKEIMNLSEDIRKLRKEVFFHNHMIQYPIPLCLLIKGMQVFAVYRKYF